MHHSATTAHLKVKDMVMNVRLAFLLAICGLCLMSCGDVLTRLESKPRALGKTNEVVVIADDVVWESYIGDTVEYYFEAPYPIMPQPEPIFDVRQYSLEDLESAELRKELRTYLVLANLKDTSSLVTRMVRYDLGEERLRRAREDATYFSSIGQDKWATGQLIVYVFGEDLQALANNIVRAYPSIAARIHTHDLDQIDAATYLNGESNRIGERIREKFGISMKIPGNYQIAIDEENYMWVRQDIERAISNIAIMRFKYESPDQLEKDAIVRMRDRMGLEIEGSSVGSHMATNDEDLPVYIFQKELDGHYTIEARGIWELTQDFQGGPFVTYVIIDGDELLVIDTFVLAPGEDKRDFVQRLEHIVSSLKFQP